MTNNKFIRFILKPFTKHQRELGALKEHPIFREIDSWRKVKCKALNIVSPSKKMMAEKYLEIYFEEVLGFYKYLCENYVEATSSPHVIYRTMHKIVSDVNERAVAACVPTIFIDKMNVRFFKHIDILSNSIVAATMQKSYSSEFEQISSVLDMSLLFIQMEADTIEETINHMNGELETVLKGTVYDITV